MEAGIKTTESRLEDLYVYAVIHDARASVLREDFWKNKRWSSDAVQVYYPDYEIKYQNSKTTTRFRIPTGFIQGSAVGDGLVYFGSNGDCVLEMQNFDRIKSRSELADFINNSRTNDFEIPAILIEGLNVTVYSKDNIVKNLYVVGVFDNPTKIPTYNLNRSEYPISQDLNVRLFDVIEKGTMDRVFSKAPDIKQDAVDMQPQTK